MDAGPLSWWLRQRRRAREPGAGLGEPDPRSPKGQGPLGLAGTCPSTPISQALPFLLPTKAQIENNEGRAQAAAWMPEGAGEPPLASRAEGAQGPKGPPRPLTPPGPGCQTEKAPHTHPPLLSPQLPHICSLWPARKTDFLEGAKGTFLFFFFL